MRDDTAILLEKLADKLGTTAEYLFEITVQQAPIYAFTKIGILLVSLIMVVLMLRHVANKTSGDNPEWDPAEGGVVAWIIAGVISMFFGVGSIVSVQHIVTALFNPEYWALSELLSKL